MALITNGKREEAELKTELPQFIDKYRHFFNNPENA